MQSLVTYLIAALLAWCPLSRQTWRGEPEDHARARYQRIAESIASVALDEQEPPLPGGRERTALLLASLAFWESGLREDVDEGRCPLTECDAGYAWTLWQIHPDTGLTLDGDGWRYARDRSPAWLLDHGDAVISGPDMIRDRQLAARVALHMARRSVYVWTTGARAKAHAAWWWSTHPMEATP